MIFRLFWPLSAAVSGIKDARKAALVAVSYVQLVYGRPL
jgi:hypothetical protein